MSTYAAFIDVKKAYDTVWRQGLWKRLWDEGVRGKMWRVVKSMCSTVQSAVLIGDEKTEWFELYTTTALCLPASLPNHLQTTKTRASDIAHPDSVDSRHTERPAEHVGLCH